MDATFILNTRQDAEPLTVGANLTGSSALDPQRAICVDEIVQGFAAK